MWIDILHRVDIKFFLFGLYIGFKLVSCDEESMSLSLRCQSHTKNNETSFMVDGALWMRGTPILISWLAREILHIS